MLKGIQFFNNNQKIKPRKQPTQNQLFTVIKNNVFNILSCLSHYKIILYLKNYSN